MSTRVPSGPGPQYDQTWMYWFWDWIKQNRAGYTGTAVSTYTGDVRGTGTVPGGPVGMVLSTTGVAAGTYGGTAGVPRFDIDAKGRVLSGTNVAFPAGGITAIVGAVLGTSTTGTLTAALSTTGVAAGTYGTYATLWTVGSDGRITALSTSTFLAVNGTGTAASWRAGGLLQGVSLNISGTSTSAVAIVGASDPGGSDPLRVNGLITMSNGTMLRSKTSFTNGNGNALTANFTNNGPVAGAPTKWIPIDDNGTVRYIPAW